MGHGSNFVSYDNHLQNKMEKEKKNYQKGKYQSASHGARVNSVYEPFSVWVLDYACKMHFLL